jgi:two-component system NtrC family sensor kinase
MIEDITEKIQAEEEAQRLEQQLQLAGRLAAVGELAAGVAHELNNPLTAVQAFAQLLVSRDDLDESVKKDLETIYREAQRATKITGNLLSFARRHKPEKKLVSINMIMEESLELHAYRMKLNNIEVNKNLDAKLPMTMADPHQIQQVFVNIITNAEQAIVETSNTGNLWVKTRALDGMVRITFRDDGSGIAEEDLENVFDPFFTTKDVGRGTGLGLSICYGIIDGHGGRIYAESKPGEGATFVVEIPLVSGDRHNVSKKGLISARKT